MQNEQIWVFTEHEKRLITSIITKGKIEQQKNEKFAIIDFDSFYALFTQEEVALMKKWLAIDPQSIGYKLPFLGAKNHVDDIVPIANQTYTVSGRAHTIPCQYLPKNVYEAYQQLNKALQQDLGKKALVLFGYRSPARQVFIFFGILARVYDFDFTKTMQRVCFPDYSEHVCTQRQAIDFTAEDGPPTDKFDTTDEYTWLKQNAQHHGFFESYPRDNTLGMMYEPWHWHYEASINRTSYVG